MGEEKSETKDRKKMHGNECGKGGEKKRGGREEENRMKLKRWTENICRCKNL